MRMRLLCTNLSARKMVDTRGGSAKELGLRKCCFITNVHAVPCMGSGNWKMLSHSKFKIWEIFLRPWQTVPQCGLSLTGRVEIRHRFAFPINVTRNTKCQMISKHYVSKSWTAATVKGTKAMLEFTSFHIWFFLHTICTKVCTPHFIGHSTWHILWHATCHVFWHCIGHLFWHTFWQILDVFWHSTRHMFRKLIYHFVTASILATILLMFFVYYYCILFGIFLDVCLRSGNAPWDLAPAVDLQQRRGEGEKWGWKNMFDNIKGPSFGR